MTITLLIKYGCDGSQGHCTIHLNRVKMINFMVCVSPTTTTKKVQKYYAMITWAPTTNFRKKKTIFNLTSYGSPLGIHCSPFLFIVHPCPDPNFAFIVPLLCFSVLHNKGLYKWNLLLCAFLKQLFVESLVPDPYILLHVAILPLLSRLDTIPFHEYTTIYLFIY